MKIKHSLIPYAMEQADVVFKKEVDGIYKVVKDRKGDFKNRKFVTNETVVEWLNSDLKTLALYSPSLANFTIYS